MRASSVLADDFQRTQSRYVHKTTSLQAGGLAIQKKQCGERAEDHDAHGPAQDPENAEEEHHEIEDVVHRLHARLRDHDAGYARENSEDDAEDDSDRPHAAVRQFERCRSGIVVPERYPEVPRPGLCHCALPRSRQAHADAFVSRIPTAG